jgi:hypothetical protein
MFVLLAVATFTAATVTFLFAVAWTDAVYGTRMAWFLGVVVPLLALTAALAWLASRAQMIQGTAAPSPVGSGKPVQARVTKGLFWVSLLLLAIPAALAAMILLVYGALFLAHSL